MYASDHYMTLELVRDVVSTFEWPAPYTLEEDLPDGVAMVFPRCTLFFAEGFEGEVLIRFLTRDTGLDASLGIGEALLAFAVRRELDLIDDRSPFASPEKVKNGLRNQCTIALAYFQPSIAAGDFSWVDAYKAYYARRRSS